jgi:hypothetical protein
MITNRKCGMEYYKRKEYEIVEKFKKIYNNKYDYSKFKYSGCMAKFIIICPIHGEFSMSTNSHLQGHGCPTCGNIGKGYSLKTNKKFIQDAIEIHSNRYDYSKVNYTKCYKNVIITCKKHGEFSQCPHSHLQGKGCPKCKISKGESKIIKWLDENSIKYFFQYTFKDCKNLKTNRKLPFDFFIPSKNLLLEYDGEQHFQYENKIINGKYKITKDVFEKIQSRDGIKTEYAHKNDIKLLRIKYTEFKDIEKILKTEII